MSYGYCQKCGEVRLRPTVPEVIDGTQRCDFCSNIHQIEDWERKIAMRFMLDRLEKIEQILGIKIDV